MNATRSVIMASLLAFVLFLLAGQYGASKLSNGIAIVYNKPQNDLSSSDGDYWQTVLVGWAALFLVFITLADIDATAPIAAGFAWLLFLSLALVLGPSALENIGKIVTPKPGVGTPTQLGGTA